MRIN
ncbi:Protein of unknown function [Propionibacterium freudenreichii]|jgi:hypothetical protein